MPKFHSLKVREIRKETDDCVSIAFEVPETLKKNYEFLPGQHLTLKARINGEDVRRSYSICASPFENDLRVAIKKLEGGAFSTFANERLSVGDTLEVMPPAGNFHPAPLSPDHQKHYVAFAAGSGITPVISILKAVLETEPQSHFTLFYGNRYSDSIIFKEQLEGLKNKYIGRFSLHHILSQEHPGADLFYGRIDEEKCRIFCQTLIDWREVDAFFICGPEAMIYSVKETLLELGVEPNKIHFELFTSPVGKLGRKNTASAPRSVISRVKTTIDGNTFEFDLTSPEDTILEAAHKTGADLPFACKGGVCCTCKAKLLEGEVEMEVNYGLEPEEVEQGYILTCQAHPKTERIVVSFDD
ncbi:MAG: phenylacetate-CoA oxygenase/reductase subunit PaaK [Bacteroidetes bacterium]|nr:MAG: phenylacetate-CoA oxygenase/reductase subunit PaaK [Bacteroidota bacterium]